MSIRRSLIVLFLLIMILPFSVFGRQRARQTTSTDFSNLQLYEVRTGDVALSVSAIGTLEADQTRTLAFLGAGRVIEVRVQRDDYVLAGDVLARLDDTSARLSYEQAQLALERAELELQDLLTPDETLVRLAQASLDSARGAYLSAVSAVSSDQIRSAELAYQQALDNYNRLNTLLNSGLPPASYEMTRAQVGEASFNAEIARLQLEQLRTASAPQAGAAAARVRQAEAELERAQAGATQLELDVAQQGIERAQRQLERARIAYERTVLTAPFDGVVSQLNIEVGSLVAPSLPVIEMADLSPLRLAVQVDEVDVGIIREGMEVRVELDALPDVLLPARLTRIADTGTNDAGIVTFEVEVELAADDPRARVGMTAEATIIVEEVRDVLSLPNLYIRLDRRTGEAFVNVLQEDDRVEEVLIQLGLQGQDQSQVLAGLQVGDIVVLNLGGGGLNAIIGG